MQKKTHLLGNLKKQVIALKSQLQKLQKNKYSQCQKSNDRSKHHQSITYSSRFDSVSLDGLDLDRGKKRCKEPQSPFKNLAQMIKEKSSLIKTPKFSFYRRAQQQKTRQNFNSQTPQQSKTRSHSPNPITGEGYLYKKKGLKVNCKPVHEQKRRVSSRRHFDIIF